MIENVIYKAEEGKKNDFHVFDYNRLLAATGIKGLELFNARFSMTKVGSDAKIEDAKKVISQSGNKAVCHTNEYDTLTLGRIYNVKHIFEVWGTERDIRVTVIDDLKKDFDTSLSLFRFYFFEGYKSELKKWIYINGIKNDVWIHNDGEIKVNKK